jgi:hypothetical protein
MLTLHHRSLLALPYRPTCSCCHYALMLPLLYSGVCRHLSVMEQDDIWWDEKVRLIGMSELILNLTCIFPPRNRALQPVRLSFQPLIFSQPAVFFSHINQPIVFSAAYFQPKRISCYLFHDQAVVKTGQNSSILVRSSTKQMPRFLERYGRSIHAHRIEIRDISDYLCRFLIHSPLPPFERTLL